MKDMINNMAKGAITGLVASILVIMIYDSFVDETISIDVNEWHCTSFVEEEHIKANKTILFNRCVQWTKIR